MVNGGILPIAALFGILSFNRYSFPEFYLYSKLESTLRCVHIILIETSLLQITIKDAILHSMLNT